MFAREHRVIFLFPRMPFPELVARFGGGRIHTHLMRSRLCTPCSAPGATSRTRPKLKPVICPRRWPVAVGGENTQFKTAWRAPAHFRQPFSKHGLTFAAFSCCRGASTPTQTVCPEGTTCYPDFSAPTCNSAPLTQVAGRAYTGCRWSWLGSLGRSGVSHPPNALTKMHRPWLKGESCIAKRF